MRQVVKYAPLVALAAAFAAAALAAYLLGRWAWDAALMFINFGILAYLIVRFGRKPIAEFLSGHAAGQAQRLDDAKHELKLAQAQYEASQRKLENLSARIEEFEEMKEREATRARERILEEAQKTAHLLIEDARHRADSVMARAMEQAQAEMAEIIMAEAAKRIQKMIGEDDHRCMVENYLRFIAEHT